jgi:hypothetical protein
VQVIRFPHNPIIVPHMDERMGDNVNGPSLVRAPSWVERPLGRYYLYFGHHRGSYIRLAVADELAGPWRTHRPGVLDLSETPFTGHIASPDVHVDEGRREVRLYFHGRCPPDDPGGAVGEGQATRVAISTDGLRFTVLPEVLGAPYFRVWPWAGWWYALAMPGIFYRSRDGLRGFEPGHSPFPEDMRHAAVRLTGTTLTVFYTRRGDCPERILRSTIDLTTDWRSWRPAPAAGVLEPEREWEGGHLPRLPSRGGAIMEPVNQLRDPYVYVEAGRAYLLYAVAGEQGIAIAELID